MKLAVLCPARPDSALLLHFIIRYLCMTKDHTNTELLVLMNQNDKWNEGIEQCFGNRVRFFRENWKMGRHGLHLYYRDLIQYTTAEWVALMCEDFDFVMHGWDEFVVEHTKHYDFMRPWIFYPRFTNTGSVCQILSRGYINAIGPLLSEHCSIDSWINDVVEGSIRDRAISPDVKMLVDYTVGGPPHTKIAVENVPCTGYQDSGMIEARSHHMDILRRAIQ